MKEWDAEWKSEKQNKAKKNVNKSQIGSAVSTITRFLLSGKMWNDLCNHQNMPAKQFNVNLDFNNLLTLR